MSCTNCGEPTTDDCPKYKGKTVCWDCWKTSAAGLTPNYTKAEWHLTYRCTLACRPCSRACFLAEPHTENMTLEDAHEFTKQADGLGWKTNIIMIGGEPTVHPAFIDFVRLAKAWNKDGGDGACGIQIYSNGYGVRAKNECKAARKDGAAIFTDEWKVGSRHEESNMQTNPEQPEWDMYMFVAPQDAGIPFFNVCYCHSSKCCGVGVDHNGYSTCPVALFFASLHPELKDTVTKDLKDCFDEKWAKKASIKQCNLCGFMFRKRYGVTRDQIDKFEAYAATCPIIEGMPMSPSWEKVFKDKKIKGCN